MTTQGRKVAVVVAEQHAQPSAVRVDLTIGGKTLVQVMAERRSFVQQGSQVQDLPSALVAEMRKAFWRDPQWVLQNAAREAKRVRQVAPIVIEGKPFDAIEVTSPMGDVVTLVLNGERDLIEVRYLEEGKPGRDVLGNYTVVEGVRVAQKETRFTAGGDTLDVTYDSITIPAKLDPTLFE